MTSPRSHCCRLTILCLKNWVSVTLIFKSMVVPSVHKAVVAWALCSVLRHLEESFIRRRRAESGFRALTHRLGRGIPAYEWNACHGTQQGDGADQECQSKGPDPAVPRGDSIDWNEEREDVDQPGPPEKVHSAVSDFCLTLLQGEIEEAVVEAGTALNRLFLTILVWSHNKLWKNIEWSTLGKLKSQKTQKKKNENYCGREDVLKLYIVHTLNHLYRFVNPEQWVTMSLYDPVYLCVCVLSIRFNFVFT